MKRIADIKAAQIAAADEAGEKHPYLKTDAKKSAGKASLTSNKPLSRLQQIKAAQLEEVEKTGIDPYQKPEKPGVSASNDSTELVDYQYAMDIDINKISNEKTLDDKQRVKRVVLPTYLPFIDDYISEGKNYPNDVAVQVMVWLLDTLNIELGLNLALILVKQNQKMPKKFDRDMMTFLTDSFYDWANELLKNDQGVSPYLDTLVAVAEQDKWGVHPLCMSKLFSMLAKHKERTGDFKQALELCEKAEAVNPEKAGVKGLKARLHSRLKAQDESLKEEPEPGQGQGQEPS